MNRRLFLATATAGLAITAPRLAFAQSAEAAARELVQQVSTEMLALLRSPSTPAEKQAAFMDMMDRYSNMRQIAGFALGRYGRNMSEPLKLRYIEAFKQFVAASYIGRFSEYSGETIDVGNARRTRSGYAVDTSVRRGTQPPLSVRWEISDRSGKPLIEDFEIEGVSMATSQRGEFTSLINSYGGDMERFVQYLESRG